jgi:hypothetical protein
MEFIIIACSHTLRDDMEEFFKKNEITGYTLLPHVLGAGQGGGNRLDSVIWPGHNVLILLAIPEEKYDTLKSWVKEYRLTEPREGLKLFNLALKEIV